MKESTEAFRLERLVHSLNIFYPPFVPNGTTKPKINLDAFALVWLISF
jgi:hypothetical protein